MDKEQPKLFIGRYRKSSSRGSSVFGDSSDNYTRLSASSEDNPSSPVSVTIENEAAASPAATEKGEMNNTTYTSVPSIPYSPTETITEDDVDTCQLFESSANHHNAYMSPVVRRKERGRIGQQRLPSKTDSVWSHLRKSRDYLDWKTHPKVVAAGVVSVIILIGLGATISYFVFRGTHFRGSMQHPTSGAKVAKAPTTESFVSLTELAPNASYLLDRNDTNASAPGFKNVTMPVDTLTHLSSSTDTPEMANSSLTEPIKSQKNISIFTNNTNTEIKSVTTDSNIPEKVTTELAPVLEHSTQISQEEKEVAKNVTVHGVPTKKSDNIPSGS